MTKLTCENCECEDEAESFFIFNDTKYCSKSECLFALIYRMADEGHYHLEHEGMEENGVLIHF